MRKGVSMGKINHIFAICAYKESPFLEECILSIKGQTIKSHVLIITSTPNTYITEMARKYDIRVYFNENGGIVQDWNFAYKKAEAQYVTIAHQDDVYFPEYAELVVSCLENAVKPIIGFTDYVEIRNGKKINDNRILKIKRLMLLPLRLKVCQNIKWIRRRILSLGCPICCPSVTFVKEQIGGEPFSVGFRSDEDWEAWEKLSRKHGEFVYVAKALMGHRIHEESETSIILGENARTREDYIMFKKFWPDFIARILTRIYSTSEKSNEL